MALDEVERRKMFPRPPWDYLHDLTLISNEIRAAIRDAVARGVPADELADKVDLRSVDLQAEAAAATIATAWECVDATNDAADETETRERELREALAPVALTDGFDPRGFFVYLLYGIDPDRPVYVGQSRNVLSRLGSHMTAADRRHRITRVGLISCKSARAMSVLEEELIRKHQPELNTVFVTRIALRDVG